ncbi:MAG: neutral zinc metallopeptidase [Sporichthyaceae bacterium]
MRAVRVGAAAAAVGLLLGLAPPAAAEDGLSIEEFVDFYRAVAVDVDDYWAATNRSFDLPYRSPSVTVTDPGVPALSACGPVADPRTVPAEDVAGPAFYCPADEGIYLDSQFLYDELYLAHGDFAAVLVLAHEFGHHIQNVLQLEFASPKQPELQADCFAGTFAYAAERAGQLEEGDVQEAISGSFAAGDYDFTSPGHHGTPRERVNWFLIGYESGDPAKCDP